MYKSKLSSFASLLQYTSCMSIVLYFTTTVLLLTFTLPSFAQYHSSSNLRDAEEDSQYVREHSLVKPYQSSGMTIPNWEFFGSAIVTNNYIRLTPDIQSRQGGIWNKQPYMSDFWETEVTFKVHGSGSDLFGDGFAIWYVEEPPHGGPIFGNRDYFKGLAVILDTYANQNVHPHHHPYISIMVNNGTLHYDQGSDGINSELAGCESKFRALDTDARILIQYLNERLVIKTDLEDSGIWRECVNIPNVYIPRSYYFGITAATGDLSDNHDILSIKMKRLSAIQDNYPPDQLKLPRADYSYNRDRNQETQTSGSGFRKFFIYFFVIAGIFAVGGFGFFLYQTKQSSARKRFY